MTQEALCEGWDVDANNGNTYYYDRTDPTDAHNHMAKWMGVNNVGDVPPRWLRDQRRRMSGRWWAHVANVEARVEVYMQQPMWVKLQQPPLVQQMWQWHEEDQERHERERQRRRELYRQQRLLQLQQQHGNNGVGGSGNGGGGHDAGAG